MTVDQLREALRDMPGHVPVHVRVRGNEFSGDDIDYLFTLDCTLEAFPSQGRMAVISINENPS